MNVHDVNEKLGEILKALSGSPYIMASAFLLRDGTLLKHEVSANEQGALNIMHYATRIAIEKARGGSIDELVIADEEGKIIVNWVNSRTLLVVVANPLADTSLILGDIKKASKDASRILLEAAKQIAPEREIPVIKKTRIGNFQMSVKDIRGLPVTSCWVEVYEGGKRVQADLTTQSGNVSFKLLTGEYDLVVRKEGYESLNEKILMDREFMAQSVTLKSLGEK